MSDRNRECVQTKLENIENKAMKCIGSYFTLEKVSSIGMTILILTETTE